MPDSAKRTPAITRISGKKRAATQRKAFAPRESGAPLPWKVQSSLFPPAGAEVLETLRDFPALLASVWPLKAAHKRTLPRDIAELSRMLTSERARLGQPYWIKPKFISAYLYYFLPWNILRLCRLFAGLNLPPPQSRSEALPLLLDAGSGPLTVPIALLLSMPRWRKIPIHILALDTSGQPLELGQKLFLALARKMGAPWQVHTATGPMLSLAKHAARLKNRRLEPFMICAANVLNESRESRRGRHGAEAAVELESGEIAREGAEEENARPQRDLLEAWAPILENSPNLLFVEPGTRIGGNAIMRMRQRALDYGLAPKSPCTHDLACPLLKDSPRLASWCHFIFDASGAPDWLVQLSREAGLAKQKLSLSPLLLEPARKTAAEKEGENMPARVISAPFTAAGSLCRYACCEAGKCLLENAQNPPSGALVMAKPPENARRDAKSGAPILEPASK